MRDMIKREVLIKNAKTRLENEMKAICNQNGFKVDITTLTDIKAEVTKQKFYEVKPSDFMPVVVGESAWADEILTYKQGSTSEEFASGIINTGSNRGRGAGADTQIEAVKVPAKYWRKDVIYNLIELNQATKSGNWSLIEAKEESRYRNWQLGIQEVAFLGLAGNTDVDGLLTQSDVAINTTTIAKNVKDMNAAEFGAFIGGIFGDYNDNANATAMPDTFAMPTDDFLGCVSAIDEGFGLKSRLERIVESGKLATNNPNFEVKPLSYSQLENNSLGQNRYVLYRRDDRQSLRIDIPVDYVTTIADTINGFDYTSVGYGGFTGSKAYRPKEMLYFDHAL